MCLDQMPLYNSTKEQVRQATERTHLFAKQCIKFHKSNVKRFWIVNGRFVLDYDRRIVCLGLQLPDAAYAE
jgi:queuine/archaeosine tRNA-ribosyltransferase